MKAHDDEVDPSEVRKGDTIGDSTVNHHQFVVEEINGPQVHQAGPGAPVVRQWTFEGWDTNGKWRTANFREGGEKVRRYRP